MLLALSLLFSAPPAYAYVDFQTLAPGVHAAVRREPPGLAVDCNVLFIEGPHDVVMVDANIGPESAHATLAALRKRTLKPISTIIATHYHDDHMGGVSVVKAQNPQARLIAHQSAPEAIERLLKPARESMISVAPQMSDFLQSLIDSGKSYGGWPITPQETASYRNDIRIARRYSQEMPEIPLPRADQLVDDLLVLKQGERTIEIRHLGQGHTPSDLVVWLPQERIAACGDLLVWPVPLIGGDQSNVAAWPDTLDRLAALKPNTILPGHGAVMQNTGYLRQMERFLRDVDQAVKAGLAEGRTQEELIKALAFPEHKAGFCGGSKLREVLYEEYARKPAIIAAVRAASGS